MPCGNSQILLHFLKKSLETHLFNLLRLCSTRKKPYPFPPPNISLCHSFKSFHRLLLMHHMEYNLLNFKATITHP